MDWIVNGLNVALCAALSAAIAWAVLSHRVRDGVIIKAGLSAMCLGFGAVAVHLADGWQVRDAEGLGRAILMINLGLVAVLVGAAYRLRSRPQAAFQLCEWIDLL